MWQFLIPLLFGIGVYVVVKYAVDQHTLRQTVKEKYKNAVKAIIRKKEIKVVKVGLFDNQGMEIEEMSIESEKGISDAIRVGQTIMIYN